MRANQAVNKIATFLGSIQHGAKDIYGETVAATRNIVSSFTDTGSNKYSISEILSDVSWKTRVVLGTMTSGGVGITAWGVHEAFSDDDRESMDSINQAYASKDRMDVYKDFERYSRG